MIDMDEARKQHEQLIKDLEAKGDPQAKCLRNGSHTWMWLKGGGVECIVCHVLD